MLDFLFWLFLAVLIAASIEDLCRREVDHWIDLVLIFGSFGFVFFKAIFNWNLSIIVLTCFSLVMMFVVSHLLYYSRVFAGGDGKLLFSMFALFVGAGTFETLKNIGVFVALLLVCGSLWGFCYSLFFFFRKYGEASKEFKKHWGKLFSRNVLVIILVFILLSFFVDVLFIAFPIILLLGIALFTFAKAVDNVVMIHEISPEKLTEGDWLVEDVNVGKIVIKANWEGLEKSQIELLKKYNKSVKVKDGAPFVPGFLIAFLVFVFFI